MNKYEPKLSPAFLDFWLFEMHLMHISRMKLGPLSVAVVDNKPILDLQSEDILLLSRRDLHRWIFGRLWMV